MKKLLTGLIVSLSTFVLLLGLAQPVHATTEDDYYDLFYNIEVIEILVLDGTNVTTGTWTELLEIAPIIGESPYAVYSFDGYINDQKGSIEIEGQDETSMAVRVNLESYESETEYYGIVIYDDDTYIDGGHDYSPEVLDNIKIEIKTTYGWTQAHDYGRIRNESSTAYLKHNDTTAIGTYVMASSGASGHTFNPSLFGIGSVLLQSPYPDFKVSYGSAGNPVQYLVNISNTAAVRMTKKSSEIFDFEVYHWVDGAITYTKVENVNLASRNNLQVAFRGDIRPAISTQENFVANVDNLVPLESFLDYMSAWDDIYGDISDQVYIEYDGGYEPDVVGVYDVIFAVEDAEGNESQLESKVHVVDIVAPVITGTTTPLSISYNQDFNVAAWVASLTVTDNYYTGLTISIQSNNYSSNKTTLGTYTITVKSTDPSGNTGTLSRTINVVDSVGPVITGPTTISASINENLTVDQIKASLAATDAKDGNVTSSLTVDSDGLTGNQTTPGTYTVVYKAEDLSGNDTLHTVTVTIFSAPPGIYVVDGASIRLLPGANLTIQQILSVLDITEELVEDLTTNYVQNKPGTYNLSFKADNTLYNMTITVLGVDDPVLPPPPLVQDPINYTAIIGGIAIAVLGIVAIVYFVKRKKSA